MYTTCLQRDWCYELSIKLMWCIYIHRSYVKVVQIYIICTSSLILKVTSPQSELSGDSTVACWNSRVFILIHTLGVNRLYNTWIIISYFVGHVLDILARKPLWDAGLNYLHGTGHGVGAFLNVHEGTLKKFSEFLITESQGNFYICRTNF